MHKLKTKDRQFDNFVVIGGKVSGHNDNPQRLLHSQL